MSTRMRPQRVADLLRKELADIIAREVRDPRVGMAGVTAVEMSNDLQFAKVYLSPVDPEADIVELLQALDNAQGYIRVQLGKRKLGLRQIPELRFLHDPSFARGSRIEEILDKLKEGQEDEEE